MKENKKKEEKAPQTPDTPASNVRSYFTKDLNEEINAMNYKEMESLMRDLASTRNWIALLKYTSMRMPLLDATLRGTNPILDPHKISWTQGAMAGLCDIETYVIELNTPKKVVKEDEFQDDQQPEARTEGMIG